MLNIQTGINNEVLRTISEAVKKNEMKDVLKIGKEMLKYIKNPENGWVGLAAPQIGLNKRMIVVSLLKNREDENFKTVLMINPEILSHTENKDVEQEGCLSVPGAKWNVERYVGIKLRYTDEKSKENTLNLTGLSARIVQHEIDHLDGELFTDKLV